MVYADSGLLGTARWADPDYIANKYFYNEGDLWIGRNPHNFDQGIGYKDERHAIVCAGNRSGKGRSFIVNNLALWKGSTITYDPKGELPVITAPRRGDGDEYCEGLGQKVYVLDPLNHSGIDPKYLGYFDPLSGLDPEDKDGELRTWAKRIANSLIEIPQGGDSADWAKRAVNLIALIIMHVMTSDRFSPKEKTLMTVLRLILEGDLELYNAVKKQNPDFDIGNPLTVLLEDMTENKACRGWLASDARNLLQQMNEVPKFFESVRGEAADKLDWFKSAGIEHTLTGKVQGEDRPELRKFDPIDLKTDPHGVSVYIVMPVEDLKTYGPWVQTVFMGIFAAVRRYKGKPATGHQILTFLDEFSSLGYQEYIASSLDNIAGEGMKLIIIMQNFGKLKKMYGDEMESFFTNAGMELYFGKIGDTALEYLRKNLGETEVIKVARSANFSKTQGQSEAHGTSTTTTEGGGESSSKTYSFGKTDGQSWNWSKNVNWSDSKNWGQSNGTTMGRNYGPHVFDIWPQSKNRGVNLNRNSGKTHTQSGGRVKGGGRNKSTTETHGTNETVQSSWSHAYGETHTTTHTESETIGGGISESFHKKPLLEPNEFNWLFNPISENEKDHLRYPGFALVRIQGEHAFFVRRSHYDQDPFFENTFSADPVHGYLPLSEVPLLGYQYTEDHVFPIKFPRAMVEEKRFKANTTLRPLQRFERGAKLFSFVNGHESKISVPAPFSGRVMDVANDDIQSQTGAVITVRADIPLREDDRELFERGIFDDDMKLITQAKQEAEEQVKIRAEIKDLEKQMESTLAEADRIGETIENKFHQWMQDSYLWACLMPVLAAFSYASEAEGFWSKIGVWLGSFLGLTILVFIVYAAYGFIHSFIYNGHVNRRDELNERYRDLSNECEKLYQKLRY